MSSSNRISGLITVYMHYEDEEAVYARNIYDSMEDAFEDLVINTYPGAYNSPLCPTGIYDYYWSKTDHAALCRLSVPGVEQCGALQVFFKLVQGAPPEIDLPAQLDLQGRRPVVDGFFEQELHFNLSIHANIFHYRAMLGFLVDNFLTELLSRTNKTTQIFEWSESLSQTLDMRLATGCCHGRINKILMDDANYISIDPWKHIAASSKEELLAQILDGQNPDQEIELLFDDPTRVLAGAPSDKTIIHPYQFVHPGNTSKGYRLDTDTLARRQLYKAVKEITQAFEARGHHVYGVVRFQDDFWPSWHILTPAWYILTKACNSEGKYGLNITQVFAYASNCMPHLTDTMKVILGTKDESQVEIELKRRAREVEPLWYESRKGNKTISTPLKHLNEVISKTLDHMGLDVLN